MSARRNCLVIMVKKPVAGRVKTRLAANLGVGRATGVFRTMLAAQARRLGPCARWQTVLAVSPDSAVGDPALPRGLAHMPQGAGDLAERMQRMFDARPQQNVLIIGADIPGITAQHIAEGFALLKRHDAVFGPAEDGGYWLVGRRAGVRRRFFDHVRWSSAYALADTLRNLESLKTGFLESLNDIDDIDDFRRWQRKNHR